MTSPTGADLSSEDVASAAGLSYTAYQLGAGDLDYLAAMRTHALRQIALAELARDRAASPEVRELAQGLLTRAADALPTIEALGEEVAFPRPGGLTWWDQRHLDALRQASAETFDRDYVHLARRALREAKAMAHDGARWVQRDDLRQHARESHRALTADAREARRVAKTLRRS